MILDLVIGSEVIQQTEKLLSQLLCINAHIIYIWCGVWSNTDIKCLKNGIFFVSNTFKKGSFVCKQHIWHSNYYPSLIV